MFSSTKCTFLFCNHLAGEKREGERAGCFTLIVALIHCDCSVFCDAFGWSAVCDCGILIFSMNPPRCKSSVFSLIQSEYQLNPIRKSNQALGVQST